MSDQPPLRYGIIGTGMMGLEHMANLAVLDGAEVVAIADPVESSRAFARLLAPEGRPFLEFEDHRALLDAACCDAVVVASPNMTHAEILLDVIDAGVDCLAEKPLCTTVEDCREVIEAASGSDAVLWVGLEYRYMPPIARAIELAGSGAVGTVAMVAMREHRFPFLPKVGDWNRFNANTGGTLVEKCCHFFDLMGLLAGAPAVRVMASAGHDVNHLDERYDGRTPDILDNALVVVEYENGVRGSLDLCMFAEGSVNQEELCVVGSEGKIEAFLPSGEVRLGARAGWRTGVVVEHADDERIAHEGLHHGASYVEHLEFLDAVRNRRQAPIGLAEGMAAVAVGVAAQRAAAEHRVVELAEVLEP